MVRMSNEILGNQYKDFAIKAQRLNIYLYTKSYKTQIKRMPLIRCQPKIILYIMTSTKHPHSRFLFTKMNNRSVV